MYTVRTIVHLVRISGVARQVTGTERFYDCSLVDYNRASVPLMEIVSDSSIRSAAEADAYLIKIRQLVRYLEASSGDMEKGAMRCEANVSVRPEGSSEYGTKVEVKNLNLNLQDKIQVRLIRDYFLN